MFTFLLVLQTVVAVALCTVILLQRSEGGGLGVGGSSSGFMTARGAADFLTRATAWLGGAFVLLCIALAAIAGTRDNGLSVDASIANQPIQREAPASPLDPAASPVAVPEAAPTPATTPANGSSGAVPAQ